MNYEPPDIAIFPGADSGAVATRPFRTSDLTSFYRRIAAIEEFPSVEKIRLETSRPITPVNYSPRVKTTDCNEVGPRPQGPTSKNLQIILLKIDISQLFFWKEIIPETVEK
jgi:hypothetical protein